MVGGDALADEAMQLARAAAIQSSRRSGFRTRIIASKRSSKSLATMTTGAGAATRKANKAGATDTLTSWLALVRAMRATVLADRDSRRRPDGTASSHRLRVADLHTTHKLPPRPSALIAPQSAEALAVTAPTMLKALNPGFQRIGADPERIVTCATQNSTHRLAGDAGPFHDPLLVAPRAARRLGIFEGEN